MNKNSKRTMRLNRFLYLRNIALTLSLTFGVLLYSTVSYKSDQSTISRIAMQTVKADTTYFSLAGGDFTQDWTNIGLITVSDNWSGVPSITGYRGDDLTITTAVDPQTVTADGSATPIDVNANQTNPSTFTTGGVSEFQITNPSVALAGSGTADAPHLVIFLDTTGQRAIRVSYNLRDIDGSTDNAVQPIALQYRVGTAGNFTNVPAGFVADASTGPSLATLVTAVSAVLPAAANNQPQVQVRIITTDAIGGDEYIGVDDIVVDSAPATAADVEISGRVLDAAGRGIGKAQVVMIDQDGNQRQIRTGAFGNYRFSQVPAGAAYTFTVNRKGYEFEPQVVTASQNVENFDFVGQPQTTRSVEQTTEPQPNGGKPQQ